MNRARPRLAMALLIPLLAGCHIDQAAEVAHYRAELDAVVPAPADFTASSDLSLREAMALANQNNEELALGGEDYVQALIGKCRAAAQFAPTLSFGPNLIVADRPESLTPIGYRNAGSTVRRFEAPVNAGVNLFQGGASVAGQNGAEAIVQQRRLLLVDLQATVMLDVARAYYGVLRAERAADVLRSTLSLQDANVLDVERRLNNGLATTLALAQVKAQRDGTRASLAQAEGDATSRRSALSLLLGVPSVHGTLVGGFAAPNDQRPLPDCEQVALAHREDLAAAAAAAAAAREQVDAAFAQYYPSVSLDFTGFLYREDYANVSRWTSLLALNLPLFTGGRIQADVREAWSRYRQALLAQSLVRRNVLRDVQVSHSELATANRRITELRSANATAQDALRLAQSAFANNLATNLDVLTAQDRALAAQLDLTTAEFDLATAYLDLVRATGGIQDFAAEGVR
jgi:outer membrane protein TolC